VNDIKSKIKDFKEKKHSEKNLIKHNELDMEINKDLLNKFKKIPINEDRDQSAGTNLNPEAVNPNRKLQIMTNGNNNIKQNTILSKDREVDKLRKKQMEDFQNQIFKNINNKENNLNNINTLALDSNENNKQTILENNVKNSDTIGKNNSIKSFLNLNANLEEKISNRLNHGHK